METPLSRRHILEASACGFGWLAARGLLAAPSIGAAASGPHFAPRARRVIFLYMSGGPSQMDTFDYKPLLQRDHGKPIPGGVPKLQKAQGRKLGTLLGSPFRWMQHGECGHWISELFPHVAGHADKLAVVKSMHTEGFDHANATLVMNTGTSAFVRPSMGSWISYGLGSENESLPGFVSVCPDRTRGSRNHSCGFLPAHTQATVLGHDGTATSKARIRHLDNPRLSPEAQRRQLDFVRQLNRRDLRRQGPDHGLEGMVEAMELGFRMQRVAPEVLDLSHEPKHVLDNYGVGGKETDDFARQCLMGRRLAEAGVRFVQLSHTIKRRYDKIANWDQHQYLEEGLRLNAGAVDQPIAALLSDLEQRGLLDDTLVVWGGEFGRTSVVEYRGKSSGRDHNPLGFTMWLAGGGTRGGVSYGETDDYGYRAAVDRVHVHDLHATILHLLGIDHERLTYRHAGRDFRLTDVYGRVVDEILA